MSLTLKFVLVFAVLGLFVALLLSHAASQTSLPPALLLSLWPTSILGFGYNEPLSLSFESIFLVALVFGGNAVVYGALGLMLAQPVEYLIEKNHKQSKKSGI